MPRPARFLPVGVPAHVTNRGNDRRRVFRKAEDYQCFVDLLGGGVRRFAVDLYGYSAMPTHFHLIISQRERGALSAYLHWVTGLTASNYRSETASTGRGHVFQRRFWSQAIKDERHFLVALKYVEANARRASLVERAEDWQWTSLWERLHESRRIISPPPIQLPEDWCELVNRPLASEALEHLRCPAPRGRPRRHAGSGVRLGRTMPQTNDREPRADDFRANGKGAWPLL